MATAFGAKRPKTGRTVDDIARMSPEDWRELQDEIQRDYAKRYLGLADAAAAVRRFQKDAEAAQQRQARPSPFGGGAGRPPGGTIGSQPVQFGRPGLEVEGTLPYPPYPPERRTHTLDFEMTAPSPSGALPRGTGGPLGVSRPTLPGALPGAGTSFPLGPQAGTPVEASIDGRPVSAELLDEGGGFDPKIAAMLLASISDAVKENLTLQGARGAKGTAAPNLLQVMEHERIAKRDEMNFRLELSKHLAMEPERRMKAWTDFADLAAKMSGPFATSDPDQQKVMKAGLEQLAEQSGMPRSLAGKYLAQGQAALESVRHLLPHLKDNPAALQVITMRAFKLLDEGKFQATVQEAANFGIRRRIDEELPNALTSVKKLTGDKDIPFDAVVDFISRGDTAIRDYLTGATAPKDEYERLTKSLAGMGVAMPEAAGELAQRAKEVAATELARNAPAVVAVRAQAEVQVAEAKRQAEMKYVGTEPFTVDQIGALRKDYETRSANFIEQRNAYYRMASAATRTTTASDITRLYAYIKMQDPNAVREGELALIRGTGGALDQMADLYNRILQGTAKLTDTQRRNLETEVREMYRDLLTSQLDIESDFKRIATKRGADPNEAVPPSVVGRLRDPAQIPSATKGVAASPPPTNATVEQGRAELSRLTDQGLTHEQALAAMRKAGWK